MTVQEQLHAYTGQPDLCITGGLLADVFSGQWVNETDLLIKDGKILDWVPQGSVRAKETLDVKGSAVIPALIDSHVHIESSFLTPERFADLVIANGTGCIIADPHEIANVLGMRGINYMIEAASHTGLDVRFMFPSCVPATPFEHAGAKLGAEDFAQALDAGKVLGLAEVMNVPGVLAGDAQLTGMLEKARQHHAPVDGHAPMLTGQALSQYAAVGVKSDHECSTVQEMNERIRRGMMVHLRMGSAAKNVPALIAGVTPQNEAMCSFCCDDAHPKDISENGHMQKHLRYAVRHGISAMSAVRMATLNTARHYRLDELGALAPGYRADITVVKDLTDFCVSDVLLKGKVYVKDGRLLLKTPTTADRSGVRSSVKLPPLSEKSFEIALQEGVSTHVIGLLSGELLTKNLSLTVNTRDGMFDAALNPGLIQVSVIERHHASGHIGHAIVQGYLKDGARMNGAVATTVAHDSHNLVIGGDNARDMLLAAREIERLGGGMCVVKQGKILASLALPIAGLMSDMDAEEFISAQTEFYRILHEAISVADNVEAIMNLAFLALPVIPSLRVTDSGLFDVNAFELVAMQTQQKA